MRKFVILVLVCTPVLAFDETARISGKACRMNRDVDKLIVMTDAGVRVRVVAGSEAPITIEGKSFERGDLRPGDRVTVVGHNAEGGFVEAESVDVKVRVADALFDALFPRKHTVIGRFSVREAKTEFFSLNTGGMNYIRVDAKSAYGPKGRVWVSTLKSGDLLELSGDWPKPDLLKASYIKIITDDEPPSCRSKRSKEDAESETKFLNE